MLKYFVILTLASFALTEETTSTCLAKATLDSLGFSGEEAVTKVDSPTYCTDVYADPGRCIAADNIKTVIDKLQTEFSTYNSGYGQLTTLFDTFFGNIGESITSLWTKVTGSDEEKAEKSWKSMMAEEISLAKDAHDTCFKTYNQLTHGTSCLVTSGLADQKTSLSGTTLTVTISNSSLQLVSDCLPVVSAICLFYKGGEEAPDLTIPQTQSQKDLCELHKTYAQCLKDGSNETTCLSDDIKKTFFAKMYAPFKNIWLPSVEEITSVSDKMLEWFSSVKDKVFSWFGNTEDSTETTTDTTDTTASRILSSDMDVVFTFADDGADLYVMGGKSGVEVSGIQIQHFAILGLMITFFLRLN